MIYSKVIGTGHFLPKKILTNAELSKIVETNKNGYCQEQESNKDILQIKMNLLQT